WAVGCGPGSRVAGALGTRGLGNAALAAVSQRPTAGEACGAGATSDHAGHQSRGRPRVATVERGPWSDERAAADCDGPAFPNGRDLDAELAQHARRALHVSAGEQSL